MNVIPKQYRWQRRVQRLLHSKPQQTIRWFTSAFLSSLKKKREAFPITVSIETTNECNMACSTCPQPFLSGGKGYMSMDLSKKIIDECSEQPSLTNIVFTGFGEPLLHPQLIDMSRYAQTRGIPYTKMYTNCVLLNKENTEKLIRESGFDEITFSLNAPTQELYKRMKNSSSYQAEVENIEYFLKRRKCLKAHKPFVNLQLLKFNNVSLHTKGFIEKWMPLLKSGDCITVKSSHSFAGQVDEPGVGDVFDYRERLPCSLLWNYLFVSWNGDVTPCCVDPFKKLMIGNILGASLGELWQSPEMIRMRKMHREKNYHLLPLCDDCETWQYFL